MAIKYKVDIIGALKAAGYNSTRIRQEHIMGESMLHKIRSGQLMSWAALDKVCQLLSCQPGDLLEFVDLSDSDFPEE